MVDEGRDQGLLRIGELSKRAGVSAELLRAWERRYGLTRPTRSPGGLRLYSLQDLERVRVMQQKLAEGLAAAEAAKVAAGTALATQAAPRSPRADGARQLLSAAFDRFDEPAAQSILDELLATFTLDTLLGEVVLPYMNELGARWQLGRASIAQEHFASGILRGRLAGLARGWGLGVGPVAVLACLPAEQHDIGLIAFGLALRARGWRIIFLGSNTPLQTVDEVSRAVAPRLVVLSAVTAERVRPVIDPLSDVASRHATALGGAAAGDPALESAGVRTLGQDPVAEAIRVASQPHELS